MLQKRKPWKRTRFTLTAILALSVSFLLFLPSGEESIYAVPQDGEWLVTAYAASRQNECPAGATCAEWCLHIGGEDPHWEATGTLCCVVDIELDASCPGGSLR